MTVPRVFLFIVRSVKCERANVFRLLVCRYDRVVDNESGAL